MRALDRVGIGLVLILPLFLLHGRGIAEGVIGVIDALFLAQSAWRRDGGWLRAGWVRVGLGWWGWAIVCSAPHGGEVLGQAVGSGRFLVLAAALEWWVLREGGVRVWLTRLSGWAALYIAAQSLLQFAVGTNLFGYPRSGDGELTGPYVNPRAGPPLAVLVFPAVLPVMDRLLGRGWMVAALALLTGSVGMVLLIGQRMPFLLTLLGLFVTALLLPQFRRFVLMAGIATGLLLGASSVVSPPTFQRLVTKFSAQMGHFAESPYGEIAGRALAIASAHPVIGVGFDGFRSACEEPAYFHGWGGGDGGGAAMCVQHPHNFYLQALVEGGVPGLLLFSALAIAWMRRLGEALWREPGALRVGLFVAGLVHLWPVASSTAWTSMPLAGWFFVLLGLGLAETRHYIWARDSVRTD